MQDKIEDTYAEGYTADVVETLSQAASVLAKKQKERKECHRDERKEKNNKKKR